MRKIFLLAVAVCIVFTACQKSVSDVSVDNGTQGSDSLIRAGDTITYEIITNDTAWDGLWNEPDGIKMNSLDSVTYGSPVYYKSGWRRSFVCPSTPFQVFISAATILYDHDITANLYKNGKLIKSVKNDAMQGVTKFLVTVNADTLTGTKSDPVLTYEVIVSGAPDTEYEYDGWTGLWNMPDGKRNSLSPLLDFFPIPSGWRYTFKPMHLPFTMDVDAAPYVPNGDATVTVNFYVNGALVKTTSAQNYTYGNTYVVE
jgi:hypothetical protein